MPAAPRDLLAVQIGKETTWGTSVNPTAKLMLVTDITLTPIVESTVHEDMRGSLAPGHVATLDSVGGEASMEVVLSYEDVSYILDNLFSEATPSGGGPYTRDYPAPTTAVTTPRLLTLVQGQGSFVYGLHGGLITSTTISLASNAPWTASSDLIGKRVVEDAFASLSDRTVTPIMGNDTVLYIDAWGGTIGTTAITATYMSAELSVEASRELVYGLGAVEPRTYVENRYTGSLQLVLEVTSQTEAIVNGLLAPALTQNQIRLVATQGTQSLTIDFAGTLTTAPEIFTDTDGVITYDLTWDGTYNATLTNWLDITSVSSVATLA